MGDDDDDGEGERIAGVDEVPADDSFLFTVREVGGDEREAILVELSDDTIAGWLNYCMHWTDVTLDSGDGAVRNGELVCRKHAATFEPDSGVCTHGPCEGAELDPIQVETRDGAVYLTDSDYAFVQQGAETDPADLSTSPGSRVGF
ncbi:Rieske (2Fe-2S) protein [Halobacterium jilantaiense]|uniref:Ferredoxin subunit of nitrite reductase or a ring-hydroxylating dioxygenase n=1 Tax=Halobacterium jilantaiense TaxID=355548 RepID=A0A1I0NU93_9EURY|nr:Rieske 2Fe-2S domain-containing protein [Halobacterium jilantaiense]SEW05310.1 Ferredoxin subunit of nitrite reductase or a ring-hydroxylating dioxygenase [Halobacterium jilantaiense]